MNHDSWDDAAADAFSYLKERERTYDLKKMLFVVDTLALSGTVPLADLLTTVKAPDFVATVLSLVTMAIHGKGAVPKPPQGWYVGTGSPPLYTINPEFARAWREKRRIG